MLRGYLAANGSDVYDSTLAALEHLRQYGQGGMNGAPENDVHGLVKVFPGLRGKGTHRDNSGVINQNVNLAKMLAGDADQVLHLFRPAYIAGRSANLSPQAFHTLTRPRRLVLVPGAQHPPAPFSVEL